MSKAGSDFYAEVRDIVYSTRTGSFDFEPSNHGIRDSIVIRRFQSVVVRLTGYHGSDNFLLRRISPGIGPLLPGTPIISPTLATVLPPGYAPYIGPPRFRCAVKPGGHTKTLPPDQPQAVAVPTPIVA